MKKGNIIWFAVFAMMSNMFTMIVVAGVYSSKHGKACRSRIHAVYPDFDGPVETFKTPAGSTVRADKEVEKPF